MLLQLPADHVGAVAPRGMRQGFEAVILLDRVHHDMDRHVGELREMLLETGPPARIVGERLALDNAAAVPERDDGALRRNADKQLVSHLKTRKRRCVYDKARSFWFMYRRGEFRIPPFKT